MNIENQIQNQTQPSMNPLEESQYIQLIQDIIKNGSYETSRNGPTYSIFGNMMRFSLKSGQIPILTTKRVAWKTCFQELMWFIRGSTSNHLLLEKKVNIWSPNASREFLDSRGLHNLEEGDLGPIYGHQWRHFNASYTSSSVDYTGKGIDQLQQLIDQLKDPAQHSSRRLIISAWNPQQLDEMALPPCHILMQFNVREGKYLSCSMYQRSGDVGLGVPFNIASYSFLVHILARHCDLVADEFVYFLGNAHIYEDHVDVLKEQILREPFPFPKICIKTKRDKIEDYCMEDIEFVESYKSHSTVKMNMIA